MHIQSIIASLVQTKNLQHINASQKVVSSKEKTREGKNSDQRKPEPQKDIRSETESLLVPIPTINSTEIDKSSLDYLT